MTKTFKASLSSRLAAFFIVFSLLFSACGAEQKPDSDVDKSTSTQELRGVWISCYELQKLPVGSADEFRAAAEKMFRQAADFSLNTVFVHVRAFSDSFYPSEIFPFTSYISGGVQPDFDPFEILIEEAKRCALKLHAWINPFRVSYDTDISKLPDGCPAKGWLLDGENDSRVSVIDGGIFYNPASPEAHALVFDGIREIIENYDVDGIHIDDYFYPPDSAALDSAEYTAYLGSGGKMSLVQWRTQNVNAFVSGMYSLVKSLDKSVAVSISPAGSVKKNLDTYCADVKKWASCEGYTDYLIPQLYFGFEHDTLPFSETAAEWSKLITCPSVKLCIGLAAYKCGEKDSYAGSGENEWIENSDMLSRQIVEIRELKPCAGFVFFSFSSIFCEVYTENNKKELKKLELIL